MCINDHPGDRRHHPVGPGDATDPPSEPERRRIQDKIEGVIAVDKDMRYSHECVTSRSLTCSAFIAAPRESRHARGGERRKQRLRTTAPTKTPLIRLLEGAFSD